MHVSPRNSDSSRNVLGILEDACLGPELVNRWWFLALIWVLGGGIWYWFMSGANYALNDWPKEISYWSILKDALAHGIVPWRSVLPLQAATDRFLTIPEVSFSPQVLLLGVMQPQAFVVANLLILYTVGFLGCSKLARRFRLSPLPFLFFVGLFNFNGYLTSRFGVGHQMWEAVFFLPWLLDCLYELLATPRCRKTMLKLAAVLWLTLLQGGVHQYVWSNMVLGLLFLLSPPARKGLLQAVVLAALASSYRLVPAAWQCWNLPHPFVSGYPSFDLLVKSLTVIGSYRTPLTGGLFYMAGWWEYDLYVGVGGFLALIWYGLLAPRAARHEEIAGNQGTLGAAMLVMFLLSMSDTYGLVHQLHLPLMNSEAVSSRFIIMPFVLLLLMAADAMTADLRHGRAARVIALFVLVGTGFQLYLHALVWRPQVVGQVPNVVPMSTIVGLAAGEPGATYRGVVLASWGTTLVVLGLFAYWWRTCGEPAVPAPAE